MVEHDKSNFERSEIVCICWLALRISQRKGNMDTIHLIGSEAVQGAGYAMERAAHQMTQAAASIDADFERHRRWMEEWLARFEAAVADMTKANTPVDGGGTL